MAYFLIENFANGIDLRRSHDTAPPGSLRTLNNAFINPGGEIEKRKAFVLDSQLTAYGQTANYKGRIAGPFNHPVSDAPGVAIFRHRHNSLPGSPFVAGAGTAAKSLTISSSPLVRVWVMKSATALTDFGYFFRDNSAYGNGAFGYVLEAYSQAPGTVVSNDRYQLMEIDFTGEEPTAEAQVNTGEGYFILLRSKGYLAQGATLLASAVGDPGDWAGTGSGTVGLRGLSSILFGTVRALGEYYGQLAILGSRGIQFWDVDPDFDLNQYLRTITGGCVGPRATAGYGDGDIVFLSWTGIRSLRARDSSNLAAVDDVGSPIDKLIQPALAYSGAASETTDGVSISTAADAVLAVAIVEEASGQFWLFLKEKVYVLAVHADAKVRAWSTFDLPTVQPANVSTLNGALKSRWCGDACAVNRSIMYRNLADEVFFYGGAGAGTYDTSTVEVITPHMDMGKPGTEKTLTGFDIACTGTWTLEVSTNPNSIAWEAAGTIVNSTYSPSGRIPFETKFTHIALRLTNTVAEAAKVGQVTIYYTSGDER